MITFLENRLPLKCGFRCAYERLDIKSDLAAIRRRPHLSSCPNKPSVSSIIYYDNYMIYFIILYMFSEREPC